jgi:rod shape-determining protein MreD
MKKHNPIYAWITLIILVLLQTTIFGQLQIFGVHPDLVLLFIVFYGFYTGIGNIQVKAFTAGLLMDIVSNGQLGSNALVYLLVAAIAGMFKSSMSMDYFIFPFLFGVLFTVIKAVIFFLVSLIFIRKDNPGEIFSAIFLVEMGINAVAGPILHLIMRITKVVKTREELI